jgi:hypothetical protein
MGGELAAAADIATGAVIAHAVDGDSVAAHGGKGHFRESACLNCGATLLGRFCHSCGQQSHLHRTLSAFWHDLLHGVLHFDGKVWHTLPLLFFKPGELTRRYVHGERARFVSPLALFLFSVFFMFALFSILGSNLHTPDIDPEGRAQLERGVSASTEDMQKQLDKIDAKIAEAKAEGADITDLQRERDALTGLKRVVGGSPAFFSEDRNHVIGFKTGWPRLDKGIEKANANPNLLLYKLQTNAYKFSWMLIPISVPFVWMLFFWRRDLRMYDHAIFVTYSLSFMTLLATLATILSTLGTTAESIAGLLFFVPPIHLYKQLRGAYGLSRLGAFIRMFLLTISATIVIVLFALLLIGLGLVG